MSETGNLAPEAGDETRLAGDRSPGRVFIGRELELAELGRALEDVSAGSGRMFLIAGEAGIGKTRLVDEFGARARSRGALVAGACQSAPPPTPTFTGAPTSSPAASVTPTLLPTQPPTFTPTSEPTPTPTSPAPAPCIGDCDGLGTVSIEEVQRCVNLFLGTQPVSTCKNCDRNADPTVW